MRESGRRRKKSAPPLTPRWLPALGCPTRVPRRNRWTCAANRNVAELLVAQYEQAPEKRGKRGLRSVALRSPWPRVSVKAARRGAAPRRPSP